MCTHNYQSAPSLFKCLFCSLLSVSRKESIPCDTTGGSRTESGIPHLIIQFFGTGWAFLCPLSLTPFPRNSKQLLHNRIPGSCSKMHQSMHVLYVHLNEYGKRRGHAFFELTIQVLDDNVKLKRGCGCVDTVQFLSKHGFPIHWLIILYRWVFS